MKLQACVASVLPAFLFGACENREPQVESVALPAAETMAVAPSRPLPPVVMQVEQVTQAVQDSISAGNWSAASRMADYLHDAQDDLRAAQAPLTDIATFELNVSELKAAIARKNAMDAGLAANRAARAVLMMSEAYASTMPAAVGFLAVDARDLIYMVQRDEWNGVDETVDAITGRYGDVEAYVRGKDPALDQEVRTALQNLQRASASRDPVQVEVIAQRLIQQAERIETTYSS